MKAKHKIVFSLSLVILTTCVIKLFLPAPYINKEMQNEFWIKKTFEKSKKNIVIGGDSRVYRGVSTKHLLKSIPELSAVNLGYSDAGFNTEYLEFMNQRLDHKAEKKIMLFGITPHAFLRKCAKNEHLMELKSKSSSEIFSGLHYANFLKHFPPYTPYELFDDSTETYFIDYHKDGFAASNNLDGDFDLTYWIYWDTFQKEKTSDSLVNVFINDLQKYQNQGITVIAFAPPSTPHMEEIENKYSGFKMSSFITRLKKNNVFWIDVQDSLYNSYDGSHLYSEDAKRLSEYLGEKIKEIVR